VLEFVSCGKHCVSDKRCHWVRDAGQMGGMACADGHVFGQNRMALFTTGFSRHRRVGGSKAWLQNEATVLSIACEAFHRVPQDSVDTQMSTSWKDAHKGVLVSAASDAVRSGRILA